MSQTEKFTAGRTYDNGEPSEMVIRHGVQIVATVTKTTDADEDEWIARLFAAAPEMLDILEALGRVTTDGDYYAVADDATALVARVRGHATLTA